MSATKNLSNNGNNDDELGSNTTATATATSTTTSTSMCEMCNKREATLECDTCGLLCEKDSSKVHRKKTGPPHHIHKLPLSSDFVTASSSYHRTDESACVLCHSPPSQALQLQCGHLICRKCVDACLSLAVLSHSTLLQESKPAALAPNPSDGSYAVLACSRCSVKTFIPVEEGAKAFKQAPPVQVTPAGNPKTKVLCDECKGTKEQEEAVYSCTTCDSVLCSRCWQKIHSIRVFSSHSKSPLVPIENTCKVHPKNAATHMCEESGDLVCRSCVLNHINKGHKHFELEKMLLHSRSMLKDDINKCAVYKEILMRILEQKQEYLRKIQAVQRDLEKIEKAAEVINQITSKYSVEATHKLCELTEQANALSFLSKHFAESVAKISSTFNMPIEEFLSAALYESNCFLAVENLLKGIPRESFSPVIQWSGCRMDLSEFLSIIQSLGKFTHLKRTGSEIDSVQPPHPKHTRLETPSPHKIMPTTSSSTSLTSSSQTPIQTPNTAPLVNSTPITLPNQLPEPAKSTTVAVHNTTLMDIITPSSLDTSLCEVSGQQGDPKNTSIDSQLSQCGMSTNDEFPCLSQTRSYTWNDDILESSAENTCLSPVGSSLTKDSEAKPSHGSEAGDIQPDVRMSQDAFVENNTFPHIFGQNCFLDVDDYEPDPVIDSGIDLDRGIFDDKALTTSTSLEPEIRHCTGEPVIPEPEQEHCDKKMDVLEIKAPTNNPSEENPTSPTATKSVTKRHSTDSPTVVWWSSLSSHSFVKIKNGDIYGWGKNDFGQLGLGEQQLPHLSTPQEIVLLHGMNVTTIACGANHTMALLDTGDVYSWGDNCQGQLGLNDFTNRRDPNELTLFHGKKTVAIACGWVHTVSVLESGAVFSWGHNKFGQLGVNCLPPSSGAPQEIVCLRDRGVSIVACGAHYTMAVLETGDVFCWGANESGQLGLGDSCHRYTPQQLTHLNGKKTCAITCGNYHTIAMLESGEVYGWGSNNNCQLGMGEKPGTNFPEEMPFLSKKQASLISCGGWHTVALLKSGSMIGWGRNNYGQLGMSASGGRDKCMPHTIPHPQNTDNQGDSKHTKICKIACGLFNTIALMETGEVIGWGMWEDRDGRRIFVSAGQRFTLDKVVTAMW
ncbi:regulator of chromosome condensation RCC1 [Pelomyxa schiedti]|nr:regulator of chromosome condensation RCC1 [Pelomyxa schiedti]